MKASTDQQGSLQRILVGWIFAILSIHGVCISPPIFAQSSKSSVIFTDVTEAVGINFVHSSGKRSSLLPEDVGSGAAFADYNNDGYIDLYVVNNPGPLDAEITDISPGNVLYRNNGDGTFTDVTEEAGVGDRGYGMGCVFGDYDNDGDLDLYVTNYEQNVLYRNNGDETFSDVTEEAGVGDARWGTGAAFGDYDNDGDLDLYVPNYIEHDLDKLAQDQKTSMQYGQSVPRILNPHSFDPQDNVLYRNNGDGTFTDVTAELGVESPGGRSLQVIFTDFDLDGDLELYVANDLSPNFLYRNNGDGTFTDISDASWAADFRGSMGLATGDYDGDGDLDLFMSHWIEQENALYSNMWKEEGAMGGKSSKKRKRCSPSTSLMTPTVHRSVKRALSMWVGVQICSTTITMATLIFLSPTGTPSNISIIMTCLSRKRISFFVMRAMASSPMCRQRLVLLRCRTEWDAAPLLGTTTAMAMSICLSSTITGPQYYSETKGAIATIGYMSS